VLQLQGRGAAVPGRVSVAARPLSDPRSWMRVELAEVVPQPSLDQSLDAACDPELTFNHRSLVAEVRKPVT